VVPEVSAGRTLKSSRGRSRPAWARRALWRFGKARRLATLCMPRISSVLVRRLSRIRWGLWGSTTLPRRCTYAAVPYSLVRPDRCTGGRGGARRPHWTVW